MAEKKEKIIAQTGSEALINEAEEVLEELDKTNDMVKKLLDL